MKLRGIREAFGHILGVQRWEPSTEAAEKVRDAVDQATLKAMGNRDLDTLERACSALATAIRSEYCRRWGMSIRSWSDRQKGPGKRKAEWTRAYGWRGYYEWDGVQAWVDHPYRLIWKAEGVEWFVSEPYRLDAEALRQLVVLADAGWSVSVNAEHALHFAGHTMQVLIRRGEEGS